jgi:polyisoprenoid-binding protein YceI
MLIALALRSIIRFRGLYGGISAMAFRVFLMITAVTAVAIASPGLAGDNYHIDHEHVSVNFTMQHSKWAKYQGTVRQIAGEIFFDKIDVAKSTVKVEMASESVDTLDKGRDSELQSFMKVREFPKIVFQSTGAEKTGEKAGKITGNLSMAGITKPLVLDVIFDGEGTSSWDGLQRVGFSATGHLNINDFGLTGVSQLDIGPQLDFTIEVEAYR